MSSTAIRSILSILRRLQEHAGGLAKSGAGLVTRRDLNSLVLGSILGILGRLEEHACGPAKSRAGLVARQDLNSLVDACKLLGVEARALGLAEAMRTPCSEGQEKATDKKGAIYDRI